MITQYTSPLIPASVVDGHFPQADEGRLAGLAAQWMSVDAEMTSEAARLSAQSRTMFANWTGSGADTAYAQVSVVTSFASSVSAAAVTVAKGCRSAASFVANTKAGINVVLIHLDNLTKQQILIGLTNPLLVPACLERILELRARAHAIIAAYSEALVKALGGIPFAATIQPRPGTDTGSSGAGSVSTTTTTTSTGSSRLAVDKGSTAGTSPAAGTRSTGTGSPASTSTGSATGTVAGALTAGWTGALATFTPADVTSAITKVPPSTDATAGSDTTGATSTRATPASAGASGHQTGSSYGTNPTGVAPGSAPTDGSNLMSDKGSLYTDMGQTPPQAGDAGAATGTTTSPTVQPKLLQSISDQVSGTGTGNDVSRSLSHSSTWSTPGAGPSSVHTAPSTAAVTVSTGPTGAPQGAGTPPTSGAPQNWAPGHPAANVSAPVAPSNPAPVGTTAAGGDGSGASATLQNAAPAAPVMPVANTTTVFGGSPGGTGPSIQIAPGTAMASPATTGLGGPAPTGGSPFATTTNVPPAGAMAAPTSAVPGSAVPPTSVAPTSVPAAPAAAAPAAQPVTPHEQAGPSTTSATQPLRVDPTRPVAPGAPGGGAPGGTVVTVATAIAALGLVGAAAQHFTGLWHDLGSTTLLRPTGTLLPTQFGSDDELLAAMPLGMDTVYEKVLLPGEADQLFAGQVETLRGLVYPYQAVRELRTPADLYDVLGLGFTVSGVAGSDTLAFNRDAESVEVLCFAGLRQDDLVTPIDTDVTFPAGTVPPPLVRHHRRPWTGTGEAPGSSSENVIEEHEILGYASVGIPHLAEVWRLHADGSEEYVSTFNARNGQWVGDTSPRPAFVGRRIDNGAYAGLSDGTVYRTTVLTDRESVLVAYGVSAPEHFEQVHDGSFRTTVSNSAIVSVTGVATIGTWHALPIQLLQRQGTMILVDYAGDDPALAAAAGFPQVNQGQWQPRWVEHTEVTDIQELERHYPVPRAAGAWQGGTPGPGGTAERGAVMVEEDALGGVR